MTIFSRESPSVFALPAPSPHWCGSCSFQGGGGAWLDHRPPESVSHRSLCAQSSFGIRSEGEEGPLEEVAVELGPKRGARASRREVQAVSAGSQDAGAPGWGWRRVLEELGSQHSES